MRRLLLTIISITIALFANSSVAVAQQTGCPTVTQKTRPALAHGKSDLDLKLDASQDPPSNLAQQALETVGRFESGGAANPWISVSNHERLSLGVLQWNWQTHSLRNDLLKRLPDNVFNAAPPSVREGLRAIAKGNKASAERFIEDWTTRRDGEHMKYGVRPDVAHDLQVFLDTDTVRQHQQQLVARTMKKAYALSLAWLRDQALPSGTPQDVDARTLAYFFDLVTFNGDRANLWLNHVREFRAQHPSAAQSIQAAADWIRSCRGTRVYGLSDGLRNADYWPALISKSPAGFNENQIDLFVLGLLRAWRSVGDNGQFPGIYQVDVLNRRGIIALGSGYSRRSPEPVQIFSSAH